MERIGLRAGDPQSLRDDWLLVAAWMQKVEEALDDVETLGTGRLLSVRLSGCCTLRIVRFE
jgi:hypothetical protein